MLIQQVMVENLERDSVLMNFTDKNIMFLIEVDVSAPGLLRLNCVKCVATMVDLGVATLKIILW